ncbi:putative phospholipase B-like lamina ancestor [Camponotus floridanus]|uniref:putative phospholipase B-like lamina ancestor n=1 Tax=Camponotus floridanus TaxID=104421 RepID=UPI00059B7346|nr:putative phospholipase B-like lamina ancestor [Camponotus floridanus]
MLKVVGASWLQTRISTYILVAVALIGIGAIILGEFDFLHVEKDGIYSATVSWNHKGGCHIEFWGQGNDLANVKLNVARAYYKTSIFESGWSIIEIETSSKYPDDVQAYAAGLLEGSLTWQLIYHHWYNTVNTVCEKWAAECWELMNFFRENTAIVRKRAEHLAATDPFWHMVRLFYIQLDGLEAGWKYAVRRSRQTVEINTDHFLWLAIAADLPDLEQMVKNFNSQSNCIKGMIFLKSLPREGMEPLIAIGHSTIAPYAKMLRLLKKYTFGYHLLPKTSDQVLLPVPGRSVIMSSYPGALSSHDEFYVIQGQNHELIVAGIPWVNANRSLWNFTNAKDQVMSSVRVMTANRLKTNGQHWFDSISKQNNVSIERQWVILEPRFGTILLIKPGITRKTQINKQFAGSFWITEEIRLYKNNETNRNSYDTVKNDLLAKLQANVTTMEQFMRLMRGYNHETSIIKNEEQAQILTYRGDLEKVALPFGVIDAKIVLADINGIETFEAISGPSTLGSKQPFQWSKTFPNVSHVGQPDIFNFDSVTPLWVWL